jgi:hypothetical protein
MATLEERPSDLQAALGQSLARRQEAMNAYKTVLDERGNQMFSVSERRGPNSKAYVDLEHRLSGHRQQLERIASSVKRPISRWGVRSVVLAIVGVGLALLEAPANKFLFDVALQSTGIVSYAVSAGVTAFLLFLAHFAGRSARQAWSDHRKTVIWSFVVILVLCIVVGLFIVAVLTVARHASSAQVSSIGDLLSDVQGRVQDLGPLGALGAALSDTSALLLACINLGGMVTTFVLAFFSHDSDRDYDHAQNLVDHDEKQMQKIHEAYLNERRKIVAKYAPDLVGYAANYNAANGRIIELKTRLRDPLDDADRFVLTDLDQMSENAEKAEKDIGYSAHPAASATRGESTVTPIRKAAGTESA